MNYQNAANLVLMLHVGVVLFITGGLLAIVAGNLLHWRWVNAPGFRVAHLGAIGCVLAESWLGLACPLTTLENALRLQARGTGYSGGFIAHWLQAVLYYQAPPWVFGLAYSVFGALVLAVWFRYPVRWRSAPAHTG